MERLAYKMILPYLSLFIILLGATKTQYGYITSAGLIVGGIMGPFVGQSIDRFGPKKVYLIGIYILIGGYLALSAAKIWQVAALGLFLHSIGGGISGVAVTSAVTVLKTATEQRVCLFVNPLPQVFWV